MRQRHWLIILLLFVLATRAVYILSGVIPFSFDHGKDSLAVMHMLTTKSPALIGPWTSIPGLFFGPGWYYLLAPGFLLTDFDPVGPVLMMVVMNLTMVILAWKYIGRTAAMIFAAGPFWLMISTGAWNPYPMAFLTLVILIALQKAKESVSLSIGQAATLGLAAGFGFHFSAAYAIFYLPAILLIFLLERIRLSVKTLLIGLSSFILPFVPQILFELKNGFLQTRAVIKYFSTPEPHAFGFRKVLQVVSTTLNELSISFVPELRLMPPVVNTILRWTVLVAMVYVAYKVAKKKKQQAELVYFAKLVAVFIVLPMIGFFFLHFNVWYVYAMLPLAVLLVAYLVDRAPKPLKNGFLFLLLITPFVTNAHFLLIDKQKLEQSHGFLPAKVRAIRAIHEEAGEERFSSYQYVPDIYDFAYQYLYFEEALDGKPLPVEFAYRPDAEIYVTQKNDLLEELHKTNKKEPKVIFFIIEKPRDENLLSQWWTRQKFGEITKIIPISEEITVYKATPLPE